MRFTCAPDRGARVTICVPRSDEPSYSRIVAATPASLPLYTPMFVRKRPLESDVNTDTAYACDGFIPVTNIPFVPPPAIGE